MGYNKLTPELIEQLRAIAPGRVFTGDEINQDYEHDEMPIYGKFKPDVAVEVVSKEEISAVMKLCNDNLIPVTARGAGTGLAGGCPPIAGGVTLVTTRMNKILSYDLANFTVTVQPGVLLNTLAEDAAKQGLLYPPDPGEKFATLGGNVSTNAGGMRAVKYGTTRRYVRSMEVCLANGEIIRLGANVAKTSSGYSLLNLVVGSEGTLAIITELTLELIPQPKETVSLIIPFEDINSCIGAVPQIFLAGLKPQALEFMESEIVYMAEKYLERDVFPHVVDGVEAKAYLLATFDGDSMDVLDAVTEQCSEVVFEAGAIDVLVADTPDKRAKAWSARNAFYEAICAATTELDECDVVVPIDKIPEFVEYTNGLEDEVGIKIRSYGHAGDGNVHVYVLREDLDREEFLKKAEEALGKMYEKSNELGGLVSGEHGIGHSKFPYLKESLGEESINLMFGIKKVFDPNLILNPGKVCYEM